MITPFILRAHRCRPHLRTSVAAAVLTAFLAGCEFNGGKTVKLCVVDDATGDPISDCVLVQVHGSEVAFSDLIVSGPKRLSCDSKCTSVAEVPNGGSARSPQDVEFPVFILVGWLCLSSEDWGYVWNENYQPEEWHPYPMGAAERKCNPDVVKVRLQSRVDTQTALRAQETLELLKAPRTGEPSPVRRVRDGEPPAAAVHCITEALDYRAGAGGSASNSEGIRERVGQLFDSVTVAWVTKTQFRAATLRRVWSRR